MLTCDSYLVPRTLQEALETYATAPEGSRLVAGATDILPWAREGRAGDVHLPVLIDLTKVPELQGVQVGAGRVRLGAATPFQRFLDQPALRRALPCMPGCAIWFADDQIREQATIGGNIVNASPAADGTPPLLALNAAVEMARLDAGRIARRTMPLADFLEGPGRTDLSAREIVTAIECDDATGWGGAFEKVGQRRSLVISVVCAAALVRLSADGETFADVRLAMGGIGPVPMRLRDVEAFLAGKPVSAESIAAAADLPADRIASRSRREYRREVVRGFIERAIVDALADAGHTLAHAA